MRRVIISDTSCFILLNKIGELDLLQMVYGKVISTTEIAAEFGEPLPLWVEIKEISDRYSQQLLELQVDKGESSAIALALEIENATLILDDYKARKVASQLGLHFTGTLGVIIRAKLKGILPSIKPILLRIRETDFRFSEELEHLALREAGEL